MRRRDFIAALSLAAALQAVHAQEKARIHKIAIVHPSVPVAVMSETGGHPYYPEFFKELRRLGYVEGQLIVVDRYSGDGRPERYAEVARKAVASKPDLIFVSSAYMARHILETATTIPIIAATADPVAAGLVASLARPGGNITGVSIDAGVEILGKRLETLKEAVPRTSRVAFLAPSLVWEGTLNPSYIRELRQAAQQLGLTLVGPPLESPVGEAEYRRVFTAMRQEAADALMVSEAAENLTYLRHIVELAEKARLPTMYPWRDYVEIGGLMAYAVDLKNVARRAAGQIDLVLKGANPSEMPIAQPTTFELIINLKTARTLGLEIPPALLTRADEVIE